jgi:selT/selW/selH-like putative selenoprotein
VAKELKAELGVNAEVTPGSHGVFDIIVDGKRVFCKDEVGRFPHPGEVTRLLKG